MSQTATVSPFLPLPDGVIIESVDAETNSVIVHIACRLPNACCPLCQQVSERVHGRYERTVADLPCAGRRVILKLSVRKFVCGIASCPRKIFTERLDVLVQSYARMTNRLAEMLQTLGFATCGELGERLAPKLGMQISGPTLLRRMRAHVYTPPELVSILGIDDWAWRKGMTYGTILILVAKSKRRAWTSSINMKVRNCLLPDEKEIIHVAQSATNSTDSRRNSASRSRRVSSWECLHPGA